MYYSLCVLAAIPYHDEVEDKEGDKTDVYHLDQYEDQEDSVVVFADAIVDPWAVVVKPVDTAITLLTMPASSGPLDLAMGAESERFIGYEQSQKVVFISAIRLHEPWV
jgi:hypothetical protein